MWHFHRNVRPQAKERSVTMLSGYAGRIENSNNQTVKAVYKKSAPKSPKVKTGKDLRTGK